MALCCRQGFVVLVANISIKDVGHQIGNLGDSVVVNLSVLNDVVELVFDCLILILNLNLIGD